MLKSSVMILAFLGMCGGARAEFALLPASSPTSPPHAEADAPAPAPKSSAHQSSSHHNRRAERHPPPDPLTARGFGSQVPLAFAVRQIVPPTINVSFAPGADEDALVDWQGGKRWNIVLTEAIRPLGLELKRHQAAAVIAPAAKAP